MSEHHPRWIPDPGRAGKIRLVKDEAEHKHVNPEDYNAFVRERMASETASRAALADEDYRSGYAQGIFDQMTADATLAELFPKAGNIGKNIAAAIRASFVPPVPPEPPQVPPEKPVTANASGEPEKTPEKTEKSEHVDPSLQPQWGSHE
jgi:hypothetical protein